MRALITFTAVMLLTVCASAGERCAEIPVGVQTDRVIAACR